MDWGLLLHCAALTFTLARALRSDKCGDNIKIVNPGYLTSPGYPNSYNPSQKCEWLIQAPEPYQRIMINFNPHFDLEDRECKYDYVEVIDGDNANGRVWGKYCGKIAPAPLVSSGPFLFIKFVSDYETHGAGFSIRYEVFKRGPECSRNFTSPSGVIKSPGFPEKYPNNLECTYIVFAPKMSEIILEFESFELEPDSNPPGGMFCRYDRLEIWDGFPEVGPHIGRYCGQNTPGRVRSSTGILSMVFYADSAIAKEGFSANYSILQNGVSEAATNFSSLPSPSRRLSQIRQQENQTQDKMFSEIMESTRNESAHLNERKDTVSKYRKDASEREDRRDQHEERRDAQDERWQQEDQRRQDATPEAAA